MAGATGHLERSEFRLVEEFRRPGFPELVPGVPGDDSDLEEVTRLRVRCVEVHGHGGGPQRQCPPRPRRIAVVGDVVLGLTQVLPVEPRDDAGRTCGEGAVLHHLHHAAFDRCRPHSRADAVRAEQLGLLGRREWALLIGLAGDDADLNEITVAGGDVDIPETALEP